MRAQSPLQIQMFEELPEVIKEQAQRTKADRMEFVRRMTIAAKQQKKSNSNSSLFMLRDALAGMEQMPLGGLPEDEMLNWTESDIYAIHEAMLVQTLHSLKDTRISEERFDQVINWIAEPLLAKGDPDPFSFAACCACTGVDAETMQESLLTTIIPSLFKQ